VNLTIPDLLEGSDFHGSYRAWEQMRRPLTSLIDSSESVLDVGCGNGFLLACLLLWSRNNFLPFGFDINPRRIAMARTLMPAFSPNFRVHDFYCPHWALPMAEVVLAPWLDNGCFIANCHAHAFTKIVFSAYNDQLDQDSDLIRLCESHGWKVLGAYEEPGALQVVAVASQVLGSTL
jgi:SAM-dependent methyltransferase